MNLDLDRRCLELAVADLRRLQPEQRRRALAQFQAIDPRLGERLRLELSFRLH